MTDEVRLVPCVEVDGIVGPVGAWQDAITEEEYQAADDWTVGLKRSPIEDPLQQGRALDRFRRKGRAAFNPEGERCKGCGQEHDADEACPTFPLKERAERAEANIDHWVEVGQRAEARVRELEGVMRVLTEWIVAEDDRSGFSEEGVLARATEEAAKRRAALTDTSEGEA